MNVPGLFRQAVAGIGGPVVAGKDVGKGVPLGQGRIDILMAEQGKEQPTGRQPPVGAAVDLTGGHIRHQRVGFLPVERKVGGIGVAGPERAAQAVPHQIALSLKTACDGPEMFGPRGVLFGT